MWAASVPRAEMARATTRPTSPFFILHSPLLITRGPSAAAVDSSHRRGSISISVHRPARGANPLSYLHQVELGGVVIDASAEEPGFLLNRIFSRSERPKKTLQVRRADTLLLSAPVICNAVCFHGVSRSLLCSSPVQDGFKTSLFLDGAWLTSQTPVHRIRRHVHVRGLSPGW
ncbi:hypothetical protein EDB80DRAFT_322844 [Ilyonectria destructans]|nr:hypothetical protein EDB80DRAFT_322844 [Ilyonectria destructans]